MNSLWILGSASYGAAMFMWGVRWARNRDRAVLRAARAQRDNQTLRGGQ